MLTVIIICLVVTLLYQLIRRRYTHWQHEGIVEEPGSIPFGAMSKVVRQQRSFGLVLSDIYRKHNTQLVGIYMVQQPTLLIRDPELARKIMTSDFGSFHDRGGYLDEQYDPLSANLFNLRGATWRSLRQKLTPSFSSGKLKGMFDTIDDVGAKLVQHLEQLPAGTEVDIKQTLTTYAVDIIGSVIFGLDIDSFAQPDNEFRAVSSTVLNQSSLLVRIHNISSFICPIVAKIMNRLGFENGVLKALRNIMKHTIEFREEHNIVRKDLLQLLIRLRNTGKIGEDDDNIWDIETAQDGLKAMSIDMIAAQAFVFYIAGSETTASTAAYTLYELAMHPQLLEEARQEVDNVLQRHQLNRSDKLTYEAVQDMKFLEQCIMESIRKYPGLPFLNRECTEDYLVPDMNYTIKKGTPILISLFGLHRDAEYFPEPDSYDPHRFDANANNYNQTAFMPFGEGPRHCIALRMGKINSIVAVAKVLANFDIAEIPLKEIGFKFDASPVLVPGIQLKLVLSKRS